MKGGSSPYERESKESTTNDESYETSQKLRRQGRGCGGESAVECLYQPVW
jgi:hypothetical protein